MSSKGRLYEIENTTKENNDLKVIINKEKIDEINKIEKDIIELTLMKKIE